LLLDHTGEVLAIEKDARWRSCYGKFNGSSPQPSPPEEERREGRAPSAARQTGAVAFTLLHEDALSF